MEILYKKEEAGGKSNARRWGALSWNIPGGYSMGGPQ
jgi:hypothetical protein